MLGIGVLLAVLGFGSAILYLAGSPITFALMSTLDPLQPWVGFVIGLGGLAMIWLGRKDKPDPDNNAPDPGTSTSF